MKRILLVLCLLFCWGALAETDHAPHPQQAGDGLWGYADASGRWVIPPRFTAAEDFRGQYAAVSVAFAPKTESGYARPINDGIIDSSGAFALPPQYTVESGWYDGWGTFGTWDKGYYIVSQADGAGPSGFFDVRSGFFSGLLFEKVWSAYGEGDLIPVVETRGDIPYLGYAERTSGKLVLPYEYYLYDGAEAPSFDEGVAVMAHVAGFDEEACETVPGDYFLLTAQGETIALPEGILPMPFHAMSEGLIFVKDQETDLIGYADKQGSIVIPPQFERAEAFQQGRARVTFPDGRYALIDREGRILLREEDERFSVAMAPYTAEATRPLYAIKDQNGQYGYIDAQGHTVIPPQFAFAEDFRGDYATVTVHFEARDEDFCALIDTQGNWVFPPNKRLSILSQAGNSRFTPQYLGGKHTGIYRLTFGESGLSAKEGYLDVATGFFSGFVYDRIITTGKISSGEWFHNAQDVDVQKLLPVVMDGKAGYVDRKTGKLALPCRYDPDRALGFENGYAAIAYPKGSIADKGWLLIDETGREILPPHGTRLDPTGWVGNGLFPVIDSLSGLIGYMNLKGELALPAVYEHAVSFDNGYATVWTPDRMWHLIDTEGNPQEETYAFLSPDLYYVRTEEKGGTLKFRRADHTPLFDVTAPGIVSCGDFTKGVTWYEVQPDKDKLEYFYGLINDRGEIITPPKFKSVSSGNLLTDGFHEGLCAMRDTGTQKIGYIDETGKWVIAPQYDRATAFHSGAAWVEMTAAKVGLGAERLIDRAGRVLYCEDDRETEEEYE